MADLGAPCNTRRALGSGASWLRPCRIYGDTHGQLRDLLLLFRAFGSPDDTCAPGRARAEPLRSGSIQRLSV